MLTNGHILKSIMFIFSLLIFDVVSSFNILKKYIPIPDAYIPVMNLTFPVNTAKLLSLRLPRFKLSHFSFDSATHEEKYGAALKSKTFI